MQPLSKQHSPLLKLKFIYGAIPLTCARAGYGLMHLIQRAVSKVCVRCIIIGPLYMVCIVYIHVTKQHEKSLFRSVSHASKYMLPFFIVAGFNLSWQVSFFFVL